MRWYTKLLPFFIVCWLARKHCTAFRINDWTYVQASGPGKKYKPEPVVLIEVDPTKRPDWYPHDQHSSRPKTQPGDTACR